MSDRGKEIAQATRALDIQVSGSHYKEMKIQVVEYNMANGIPYMEGNVIKYVSRWRKKGGLDDLRKAKHYLDLLIENEEKDADKKPKSEIVFTGGLHHPTYSPT